MQILSLEPAKTVYANQVSASGAQLSSSSNRDADSNTEEFICYVNPQQLMGIEIFYKILHGAFDADVIQKTQACLFNIHSQLAKNLYSQRQEIEIEFVKTVLKYIVEIREKWDLLYQEKVLCADEEISDNIQA